MPDTRIIYIAGYSLKKNTGRSKATREKAAALRSIVGMRNFQLYAPLSPDNKFAGYLCMFFLDLFMLFRLMFIPKNTFVIERQAFLPLSNTVLWLRGVRIICEVHAEPMGEIPLLQKSRAEKMLLRVFTLFEWYNWRLASAMIYVSPIFKEKMDARIHKPSIAVYNGCDTDTFVIMDMAACRRKLALEATANYFLLTGALTRWRGVDLVIDIFKQPTLANDYLLIAGLGDDDYSHELVARAAGHTNIIFRPYTDIQTSVEYINAADLCLVPVNYVLSSPGSPLKLYDCIACGKPVAVQQNLAGYSDEVERYGLGMSVDFRDAPQAAGQLHSFLSSMNKRYYSDHNRNVALKHFSWQERMKDWINFLIDLD